MYIKYTDDKGKICTASTAPGLPAEQAAKDRGLKKGEWQEISEAEYTTLNAPTAEDIAQAEYAAATSEASAVLTARMQRQLVQTEAFTGAEMTLFAKAGLFPAWAAGTAYAKGERLVHEGVVYEVQQPVTAQEHQAPGSAGMLAVYRPISADPETGSEPDGSRENPYAYLAGMDVFTGKYYTFEDALYLAKADLIPCIWNPGTAGLWQWEKVE